MGKFTGAIIASLLFVFVIYLFTPPEWMVTDYVVPRAGGSVPMLAFTDCEISYVPINCERVCIQEVTVCSDTGSTPLPIFGCWGAGEEIVECYAWDEQCQYAQSIDCSGETDVISDTPTATCSSGYIWRNGACEPVFEESEDYVDDDWWDFWDDVYNPKSCPDWVEAGSITKCDGTYVTNQIMSGHMHIVRIRYEEDTCTGRIKAVGTPEIIKRCAWPEYDKWEVCVDKSSSPKCVSFLPELKAEMLFGKIGIILSTISTSNTKGE